MAKIVPMDLVKSMSGKICMHSDTYFSRRYGNIYTGKMCNPRTSEPTNAELTARAKFKAASLAANAALQNPTQRTKLLAGYNPQKYDPNGYPSLRGYAFHIAYQNLVSDGNGGYTVNWPS